MKSSLIQTLQGRAVEVITLQLLYKNNINSIINLENGRNYIDRNTHCRKDIMANLKRLLHYTTCSAQLARSELVGECMTYHK